VHPIAADKSIDHNIYTVIKVTTGSSPTIDIKNGAVTKPVPDDTLMLDSDYQVLYQEVKNAGFKVGDDVHVRFHTEDKFMLVALIHKDQLHVKIQERDNQLRLKRKVHKLPVEDLLTPTAYNTRANQQQSADRSQNWQSYDFVRREQEAYRHLRDVLNGSHAVNSMRRLHDILNDWSRYRDACSARDRLSQNKPALKREMDPLLKKTFRALRVWYDRFRELRRRRPVGQDETAILRIIGKAANAIKTCNLNLRPSAAHETVGEYIYRNLTTIAYNANSNMWQFDTFRCTPNEAGDLDEGYLITDDVNDDTFGKCNVCLQGLMTDGATDLIRLRCNDGRLRRRHIFHKTCIDRWFSGNHQNCPVCRYPCIRIN